MIVVGLSGVASVGKDVGAAALVQRLGFTRLGFADTLREALYRLNPIINVADYYETNGVEFVRLANVIDDIGWDTAKRRYLEIRELLQRMGTEVGRELIDDQVWVTTLFKRAEREKIDRLVIPDVRFPNELAAVEEYGGVCLRIVRPGYGPINSHISDSALTNENLWAIIIHNDHTEAHYQDKLVQWVRSYIG